MNSVLEGFGMKCISGGGGFGGGIWNREDHIIQKEESHNNLSFYPTDLVAPSYFNCEQTHDFVFDSRPLCDGGKMCPSVSYIRNFSC